MMIMISSQSADDADQRADVDRQGEAVTVILQTCLILRIWVNNTWSFKGVTLSDRIWWMITSLFHNHLCLT